MTSRRWSWTLNNYTQQEVDVLRLLGEGLEENRVRYICFGFEEGEQGTPHLQEYVEFSSNKRLTGVKRLLGNRIHAERARGSGEQNRKYCSKTREGDIPNEEFHEFGELRATAQGRRSDLEDVRELIADGASDLQIADAHFGSWVRYRASFAAYRALRSIPVTNCAFAMDTFPVHWRDVVFDWSKSHIFWGPPGVGKTQFALAVIGNALLVSHMDQLKSFDPTIHDGIVFDDMSFLHMPVGSQIHIVDQDQERALHIRYDLATIPANTKKIFTTNLQDGLVFNMDPTFGVKRRTKIHFFDKFN